MAKEKYYCENCPMYYGGVDYWGEGCEGCEINLSGWFDGKDYKVICRMPRFIKWIYEKYICWKEERYWKKQSKEYERMEESLEEENGKEQP